MKRSYSSIVKQATTGKVFVNQGPGGRSSTSGHVVTVLGCTGFLGKYLVNRIGQTGSVVVAPYRGAEEYVRHLKPMGDLGQIVPTVRLAYCLLIVAGI
jgi:NADH dehydrogenase (ubiquinone) 1 alpha subcomplex subunit 9